MATIRESKSLEALIKYQIKTIKLLRQRIADLEARLNKKK